VGFFEHKRKEGVYFLFLVYFLNSLLEKVIFVLPFLVLFTKDFFREKDLSMGAKRYNK